MEIVKFSDLEDVATSHDISLRKWVLAAAGKYPSGKMQNLRKYSFANTKEFQFAPNDNELLLLIPNAGTIKLQQSTETIEASVHDLVTIKSPVTVAQVEEESAFYLVNWQIV